MISIVIPVLDEEANLSPALAALARESEPHEVIVADGGSRDRSRELALAAGARVVTSSPGRGRQMNAGALVATGEVLLFLHVDSRLPVDGLVAVRQALLEPEARSGGFLKRYHQAGWMLRVCELILNHWRSRIRRRLVGTQAMFLRRELFERLGGFREWPLLEDVELSDRLRGEGGVVVLPLQVESSARRYQNRGTLRQILDNAAIMLLYRCGVGVDRLARIYRRGASC